MDVPKLPGHMSGLSENAWDLLGGSQEWARVSLSPLENLLGKKVLVRPSGDNPSHCELASWESAAIGLVGGAEQKHSMVHLCFPSENLPVIYYSPLRR